MIDKVQERKEGRKLSILGSLCEYIHNKTPKKTTVCTEKKEKGVRMASTSTRKHNTTQGKKGKERHKEEVEGGLHLGEADGRRDAEKFSADQHFDCTIHLERERKEESKRHT